MFIWIIVNSSIISTVWSIAFSLINSVLVNNDWCIFVVSMSYCTALFKYSPTIHRRSFFARIIVHFAREKFCVRACHACKRNMSGTLDDLLLAFFCQHSTRNCSRHMQTAVNKSGRVARVWLTHPRRGTLSHFVYENQRNKDHTRFGNVFIHEDEKCVHRRKWAWDL